MRRAGACVEKQPVSGLGEVFKFKISVLYPIFAYSVHYTVIPRPRVGYEMIDSQRIVGFYYPISNKHEWNNCFIKDNQKKLLDLVDFALQEQREDTI